MSGAIDEYRDHLVRDGLRPTTIDTYVYRLHGMFRDVERDRALHRLTPAIAEALYEQRAGETKPDTHHGELVTVQAFGRWCAKQGWIIADPFAAVEPIGRRGARRVKLRIDEMRELRAAALAEGSPEAVGVLLALLNGLRASEITDRVVRDLDDGGRVLWIDHGKTSAAERWIEVPEDVRQALVALTRDKLPLAPLFGRGRHWLAYHTRRLCRAAKVPEVSPHPLRRSWTCVQQEHEHTNHVARELGHASAKVTRRHYGDAGAEQRRASSEVQRRLRSGNRKP